VIAVHDLALAGRLVPPLTTVRMPLAGLGALAVELLLGRPADSEIHEVVRDPIDPVIRESTAP
jgi:LacI family transcriptional regulator